MDVDTVNMLPPQRNGANKNVKECSWESISWKTIAIVLLVFSIITTFPTVIGWTKWNECKSDSALLKKKIVDIEGMNDNLTRHIDDLETELGVCKKEFIDTIKNMTATQKELYETRKESAEKDKKIKDLTDIIKTKEDRVQDLNKTLVKTQTKLRDCKIESGAKDKQIEKLKDIIQNMTASQVILNDTINTKDRAENLTVTLVKTEAELKHCKNESAAKEKQVENFNDAILNMTTTAKLLNDTIKTKEDRAENLTAILKNTKAELKQCKESPAKNKQPENCDDPTQNMGDTLHLFDNASDWIEFGIGIGITIAIGLICYCACKKDHGYRPLAPQINY